MKPRTIEALKWVLVAIFVALGVWALWPTPTPRDPFADHDPATCETCMMRAPGMTAAERQRHVDEIRRRAAERAKSAR